MTTAGTEPEGRRRPTRPSPWALWLLAATAMLTALLIGGALAIGRSPEPGGRAAPPADEQPSLSQAASTLPRATVSHEVRGWPTTTQNPAGTYAWDGHACAGGSCVQGPDGGFMHNGYASGDVEIYLRRVGSETPLPTEGQRATTLAGRAALYRRIDARTESWTVSIEGTTLVIRLEAKPGTSDADLAEAHAIIASMRTEPRTTKLGFRLVFALMTNDWDSG